MSSNITQKQPLSNRGLVQKIDVNQLAKDQYSFLLNMVSTQEGSLCPRFGYEQTSVNWGGSGDYSYAHTIGIARINSLLQMYIGEGTNIRKANLTTGPISGTIIATGVNSGPNRSSYIPWSPSSSTGSYVEYFATGDQMLADITPSGGVLAAGVNKWGIKPPLYPTVAAPSAYTFKALTLSSTFNGSYSYTNSRVNDTIASVTAIVATSGANGYYRIVPTGGATTIDAILPGMYLLVGAQNVRVDTVDATTTSFSAYFGTLPAAGNAIAGYQFSADLSGGVGGMINQTSNAITADLSFGGLAADGFDTQDNVHISLRVMTPLTVSDIRLRLQCGGSANDYYERSILPSLAQQIQTGATTVSDQTNAQTAANEYGRLQSTGVYGQVDNLDYQDLMGTSTSIPVPDNTQVGLQPSSLVPAIADTWSEIDIPKTSFLKVGRAGQSGYTWAEVTAVQIIVKPVDSSATATIRLGSIYAYGGNGLNSNRSANLQPYDYVYTYVNAYTQAESNPSQISTSSVYVVREAIGVKVTGTDNTGQYTGLTKIAIYRRGGAFTDGLYRLVGYLTNPGSGNTAIFEDSVEDISIIGARTAFFDNNPPVLSNLPVLFDYPIASVAALGSNVYTCTLTVPLGITVSNYITSGTQLTLYQDYSLSNSIKEQRVYAISSGAATVTAYFETAPVAGQNISAQAACNRGCDVGCSAFDRIWLAGDTWNPHILYSSKTGNPESWPVIGDGTGLAYQFIVTSPDDPIMGLVEFRNQLIILCRNDIYTATFDRGQVSIQKTPAARGMVTKGAYGLIDNELWFLSYDGIYSWSGGTVTKRTLAIDPIFNNQTVNGIVPLDYDGTFGTLPAVSFFTIAQKGNDVFANFMNTSGYFQTIRYNLLFDRWSLEEYYNSSSTVTITRNGNVLPVCSITAMVMDYYTGYLWTSMTVTNGGSTTGYVATLDDNETSVDGSGSRAIYYQANTAALDMGDFTLQKIFTDINVEITVGHISTESYYIKPYYNYSSTANAADTFQITPSATGRQIFPFPLGQTGSPTTSFGNTARSVLWEIYGLSTLLTNIWHSFALTYIPQADIQRGRISDWTDISHPYDKRMSTVTLDYNVGSSTVDLLLDYISGKEGDTVNLAAQTLTLGSGSGTDRTLQTFPIIDGVVAKMVRLRPKVQSAQYQVFGEPIWNFDKYPADIVYFTDYSDYGYEYEKRFYVLYLNVDTNGINVSVVIEGDGTTQQTVTVNGTASNRMQPIAINVDIVAKLVRLKVTTPLTTGAKFQLFDHKFDFEKLPPPIVLSTPWTDHGYDFNKYIQQIAFDVNTNGQTVPVKVYGDGVLKQTVSVNTTQATRNINITLNPSLTAKITRLEVDPTLIPSGGRFQLWGYNLIWQPADKGAVYHTYDWDDAGHPYDKKFVEMTFEYETQANSIQIGIDTLTGINGTTQTLLVKTFSIQTTSTGRGKAVIPMTANDGSEIIAKMLRVRSTGISGGGTNNVDFKMWNVKFPGMIPYPPDIVPFTDWVYGESTCDKVFRSLRLQIDTGGVAATVHLDVDGQTDLETWTVNTDTDDRAVVLTPDQSGEIIGKMFRLRFTPGSNGKAQLFGDPVWDLVKDACEFVFFDSFEQAFGSVGYTVIYQTWIDYKCEGSLTVKFFNEDGVLFYTKTLPPHSYRYPERFYLPVQYGGVNNKSKKHRTTLEAVDHDLPFKLYSDSSRWEVLNLSATQREGYFQNILWQNIGIKV